MFACARLPDERVQRFNENDMLQRLHRTLQISDLEVELLSMSDWYVNVNVAESYLSSGGKVFLVRDEILSHDHVKSNTTT